jgi:hypothetical protein
MSNDQLKNGKLPISAKSELDELAAYRDGAAQSDSVLDVDPILKNYLTDKGFTCRWINASKYKIAGGFNKNDWKALRMESLPAKIQASIGSVFGTSAEGFLVRNDLVLGIRTVERHEQHRAKLKRSADLLNGEANFADKKEKLKEALGRTGVVHTGYDDE